MRAYRSSSSGSSSSAITGVPLPGAILALFEKEERWIHFTLKSAPRHTPAPKHFDGVGTMRLSPTALAVRFKQCDGRTVASWADRVGDKRGREFLIHARPPPQGKDRKDTPSSGR